MRWTVEIEVDEEETTRLLVLPVPTERFRFELEDVEAVLEAADLPNGKRELAEVVVVEATGRIEEVAYGRGWAGAGC